MSRMIVIGGPLGPPFFEGTGPTFPDYDLLSLDDEQVKGVIVNLGLGVALLERSEPRPKGLFRCEVKGNHPTHWIAVARFEHYPRSSDNGFVLKGWARSKRTQAQYADEFQHWVTEGGQTHMQYHEADPKPQS